MSVATQDVSAMQPRKRGWFRRNWKWFVPGMLAVTALLAAIAVFSYIQVRSYRLRQNPAYQTALAAVQSSAEVQRRLGENIVDSDWNPQGAIEVRDNAAIGEARFNFTVAGPKGSGDVGAEARMVEGEWALSRLEVLFPDGERVRLTEEVLARQKVDTPQFNAAAERERQKTRQGDSKDPGPELNFEVPTVPEGLK